jgi:hypothetical protein
MALSRELQKGDVRNYSEPEAGAAGTSPATMRVYEVIRDDRKPL